MDQRVKELWCDAARHGHYKQGTGVLRDCSNNYCILGILCDTHNLETQKNSERSNWVLDRDKGDYRYFDLIATIPDVVKNWAGIGCSSETTLSQEGVSELRRIFKKRYIDDGITFLSALVLLNDNRIPLKQIADFIEKYIP